MESITIRSDYNTGMSRPSHESLLALSVSRLTKILNFYLET